MRADLLIVGQGLAGTLLAWECERAGIVFAISDRGHATAATMAAAGIVNPITGRRLVKSWRIEALLPAARAVYRELEQALGVSLWREMRVRRLFADERERAVLAKKQAGGELAPFVEASDESGCWIREAARVDLAMLLAAARARWKAAGRLRVEETDLREAAARHELVIDCTGAAGRVGGGGFPFVPWEFSKGEVLEIAVDGLAPEVVLNRRHWVAPVGEGRAWVGATHEPGVRDAGPSGAARAMLERSARDLLGGRPWVVTNQWSGVRLNLPDKRPVAGRHPEDPRLGLSSGLAAKGVLWAPLLARQWVNHLTEGVPFDAEIDVRRFAGRPAG